MLQFRICLIPSHCHDSNIVLLVNIRRKRSYLVPDRKPRNKEFQFYSGNFKRLKLLDFFNPKSAIPGPDLVTPDMVKESEASRKSTSKSMIAKPYRARAGRNPESCLNGLFVQALCSCHTNSRQYHLLDLSAFIKRGGKWLTARELSAICR